MLQLSIDDIHLAASAENKRQAIVQAANALARAGCVAAGYVDGMFARELQTSTWLGNGVAIPHGTTDTRDQVLKTGLQVFQYPQGVDWGDGQRAYLVIGIAARGDEHLDVLRKLTHLLSDERLTEQVKAASNAAQLHKLLTADTRTAPLKLDNSLLSLDVATTDLITLRSLNAGRLSAAGAVNASFISHILAHSPLSLGQGIWLDDSPTGNLASAVAISRPAQPFSHQGQSVNLLISVAMADDQPRAVLTRLSQLLTSGQASRLQQADVAQLLALLSEDAPADSALSAEFVVRNPHGLHARPGAMLINTVKQFTSEIKVANLQGDGKPVNARSLMKVVALGVKQGHTLRFTASGTDAQQALDSIGQAIHSGLGEDSAADTVNKEEQP